MLNEQPNYSIDGIKLDQIKHLEDSLHVAFVHFPNIEYVTLRECENVVSSYFDMKGQDFTIQTDMTKFSGKFCVSVFFTI